MLLGELGEVRRPCFLALVRVVCYLVGEEGHILRHLRSPAEEG